jgi:hypothetical protein
VACFEVRIPETNPVGALPGVRSEPREKCTLSTGKLCVKPHLARSVAASNTGTENLGQAALRTLIAATSGALRTLFRRG